jgi:hypothetical protein
LEEPWFPGSATSSPPQRTLPASRSWNEARRLSPLISRLRFQATNRTEAEWDIDYDFKNHRINASTAFVNYHFGPYTIGGGDAFLQAPSATVSSTVPQDFNQFRVLFGYGYPNRRGFSGATNLGFDANLGFLQYSAVQLAYNWDCCGLSVEYRRLPWAQFATKISSASTSPCQYWFIWKFKEAGEAVLTVVCVET